MKNIAINGFGRIGRAIFKIIVSQNSHNIVAINDLGDIETFVYLLKHDTVYGFFDAHISIEGNDLVVNGKSIKILHEKDPAKLPWENLNIDVVIESTGIFRKHEQAMVHVKDAGAKAVIISAPAKDDIVPTYVKSVNDDQYVSGQNIISNASCTTNCISPIMNILENEFGVEKSMMTTIHSYTADQRLVDGNHKDLRRGRSAAQNIIPTSTGAAIATTKVIPSLQNRFDGLAIRVPTPVVSLSDITAVLKKDVTVDDINNVFIKNSKEKQYKNVLGVTFEPLVSSDFIGSTYSTIVDLTLTKVVDKNLVKVVGWYDNEWGYACRLVEMIDVIS